MKFYFILLFLVFLQLSGLNLASANQCRELLTESNRFPNTEREYVVIDLKNKTVYKELSDLEEVMSLEFAAWLLKKLDSKNHQAVKPIKVYKAKDFHSLLIEQNEVLPVEFMNLIAESDDYVVVYPFIEGDQYMISSLSYYPTQQQKKISELARDTWREIERLYTEVNKAKLEYRGHSVKAELFFDDYYFKVPEGRAERMDNLNGPGKMVFFSAGELTFILSFGGGNRVHGPGITTLIDPY